MWRVKTIFLGYVLPLFILTIIVVLLARVPKEQGIAMMVGGIPIAMVFGFLSTDER